MSNFFDTVRSLQEDDGHMWRHVSGQTTGWAHEASRTVRTQQDHAEAAAAHGRAAYGHEKAAAGYPEGSFGRNYHTQMSQHHSNLEKLHTTGSTQA